MQRREFARNVVGAIFGVSAIPAFGSKPASNVVTGADPSFCKDGYIMVRGFWHSEEGIQRNDLIKISVPPADISEATKIHLREMWG